MSSRDEAYYDVQLKVKDLSNLTESFRDYIAKETLEGDNRYDAGQYGMQVHVLTENGIAMGSETLQIELYQMKSSMMRVILHSLLVVFTDFILCLFSCLQYFVVLAVLGSREGRDLSVLPSRPSPSTHALPVRPQPRLQRQDQRQVIPNSQAGIPNIITIVTSRLCFYF